MAAPSDSSVPQQPVTMNPSLITSSPPIVIPSSTGQIIIPSSTTEIVVPSSPSFAGITVNAKKNAIAAGPSPRVVTRVVTPGSSKVHSRQVISSNGKTQIGSGSSKTGGNSERAIPSMSSASSTCKKPSITPSMTIKPAVLNKSSANTPNTSSTPRTPSTVKTLAVKPSVKSPAVKPSVRKPDVAVNSQVGKAIAEKKATLFQELSKVMRDTVVASTINFKTPKPVPTGVTATVSSESLSSAVVSRPSQSHSSVSPALQSHPAVLPTSQSNAVVSPALQSHVAASPTFQSHAVVSPVLESHAAISPALQSRAAVSSALQSHALVIPTNQPNLNHPSTEKITSIKQNPVSKTILPTEAVVIPSTTGPSSPSFLITSHLTSDVLSIPFMPVVSPTVNSSLLSQPRANLVVEPVVSQSSNNFGSQDTNSVMLQRGPTHSTIVYAVSTTAQNNLSLPNSNQLYAVVQTPPLTPGGVQPTVVGNIVPSSNSIPLAHVQNGQEVSMGSIESKNVLSTSPGTVLFALVENHVVPASTPPVTATNTIPVVVKENERSRREAGEPDSKQTPETDPPTDNEPGGLYDTGDADFGVICSEPIDTIELSDKNPVVSKTSKSGNLSEKSIHTSVVENSNTEVKNLCDVPEKKGLAGEKMNEEGNLHHKQTTIKAPPKKLSAAGVVKNQMKRIENFYNNLSPKQSFYPILEDDYETVVDKFDDGLQNLINAFEKLKRASESYSSSCISAEKCDTDRGQILCRLCAGFFKREALIPIYDKGCDKSHLAMMINSLVPESIHVQALDGLPQDICKHCADKLTGCYEIINGFVEADKRLREILGLHARSAKELLPKKSRVREEMQTGTLATYSATPPCRKRTRDSSSEGIPSDAETQQPEKKRLADMSSASSIDYSRLDPEYDVGFEVEWCLDEETIRSTLVISADKETAAAADQNENVLRMEKDGEALVENTENGHSDYAIQEHWEQADNGLLGNLENEAPEHAENERTGAGSNAACDALSHNHALLPTPPCSDIAVADGVSETPSKNGLSIPCDRESIPQTEMAAGQRGEVTCTGEHQSEVSAPNQNNFECDQCELSFLNQYSYFIHKSIDHDNILDSKSLSKFKSGIVKRKKVESGKTSVKSGKKQQRRTTESQVICSDGLFLKCGSGMLWVDSSRLESSIEKGIVVLEGSQENNSCKKDTLTWKVSEEPVLPTTIVDGDEQTLLQNDMLCQQVKDKCIPYFEIEGQSFNFKCRECNDVFLTVDALNNHMPSHLSPDSVCDVCGVIMANEMKLRHHKKEHVQPLPHNCKTCGKGFPNEQTLIVHKGTHSCKKGPYRCQICKKHFYFRSTFEHHRKCHESQKSLQCPVCFRTFNSRLLLRKHLMLHHLRKIYNCCICSEEFSSWKQLCVHRWEDHLDLDIFTLKREFNTKEASPFHQCSVCCKVLESKESLLQHLSVHKTDWPFYCFLCRRCFASQDFLEKHLCYSRNSAGYQCTFCGNSFVEKKALRIHRQLHNCRGQHSCQICGRVFRFYQSLFSHILMHAGKDMKCHHCNQSFFSKGALWKHYSTLCERSKFSRC